MTSKRVYNVLVAEDESFQRFALLDILTLCDYEPTMVENGKQALEELKKGNIEFDLLLLDLYMPEMDGFEVINHMQEDENLRQIPIVVMSAHNTNDLVAECLQMGAKDYLVKPVRIQECKALVRCMRQKQVKDDRV